MDNWSPKDIEDKKGQQDIGVLLYRTYQGAVAEGANWLEAYIVVAAFCHGMMKSNQDVEEEEGGE